MNAHISLENDSINYRLDNVTAVHFCNGKLVVIFNKNNDVVTMTFDEDSLEETGRVTIC